MKRLALSCMFFLPLAAWAQKQYFLPTASPSDDEKDKPMIEVYLPKEANGCAVVLCPGGAMRWLWQRPLRTDAADGRDYHRDMEHPDDSMVEGQEFSQPGIPGGCSAYITAGNYSSI